MCFIFLDNSDSLLIIVIFLGEFIWAHEGLLLLTNRSGVVEMFGIVRILFSGWQLRSHESLTLMGIFFPPISLRLGPCEVVCWSSESKNTGLPNFFMLVLGGVDQ